MDEVEIIAPRAIDAEGVRVTVRPDIFSVRGMAGALRQAASDVVALSPCARPFSALAGSVSFMVDCLEGQEAVMVYADYVVDDGGSEKLRRLNDAEAHVVRDSFDFGPLLVMRRADAVKALADASEEWCHSAFYALTLGLQRLGQFYHTGVPVGFISNADDRDGGERQFDYVDPRNAEVQKELEQVCTAHLRSIGAYVGPEGRIECKSHSTFQRRASVVIPVRNRVKTVADAIRSALGQRASFDFNVIVVDNHSDDGTSDVVAALARESDQVVHIRPKETDLGIGGCWNAAVQSAECGKYAVQLDSDDLYASDNALQTIVDKFAERPYALVVGAYRLVDFNLEEIPPGVIDHREWTDANGANNILRVNGMGAPRAFATDWLRKHPFPNVSYGEDYAAVLAATRRYLVGRVFSVLYLCRRWGGNSDAGLTPMAQAAHDAYKDKLRSDEVEARIALNKKK